MITGAMSTITPRITVLMPVYNGEAFVEEAIKSILDQTFSDFELLVVNDGSTDRSLEILQSIHDPRIRVLNNPRNLGLIATLNKGLDLARGEYIARMDCDDVSHPTRLKKQFRFLEDNPDIGMVGSWFEKEMTNETIVVRTPVEDADIRFHLIFDNAFLHSSIVMRKCLIDSYRLHYDPDFRHAEDYELWVRLAAHSKLANLPEVLLRYRFHPQNVSHRHRDAQIATADKVRCIHLRSLGIEPTEEEAAIHIEFLSFRFEGNLERAQRAADWMTKLAGRIQQCLAIPEKALYDELEAQWYGVCGAAARDGFAAYRLFSTHPMGARADLKYKAKLLWRCLFRSPIER